MKDKDAPRTIAQSCEQARAILRDMERQGRLLRKEVVDARKSGYEDGYKAGLEDGTKAAREEARRAMARAKREWAQKYTTDVQSVLDDNPTEVGKWARAHGYVRREKGVKL